MPQMQMNDMVDIDQMWAGAEEPEGFTPIPDGRYEAIIEVARPEYTKNNQRCLYWELVIVTGPQEGKRIFRRNMLETPNNIGWLKADLRKCGIDVDSPTFTPSGFLTNGTSALIGVCMDVTLKTGKANDQGQTFQNCNFNGVLGVENPPVAATQPQAPAAQSPRATAPAGGRTAAQPGRMPNTAGSAGAPSGRTASPWK